MASLFNKFQQAIGVLAKSTTFAKNPRQLQFEADVNKLFMYTSYNRLGREAEEADAEEIIEMAGKATLSEQQKQVQENIHYQVANFCSFMDGILLPDVSNNNNSVSQSTSPPTPRQSGLTLAIVFGPSLLSVRLKMKRGGTKRKIEIKERDTPQQRSVTCSKRRPTVFSKAADLCHLAGANVAVFVPSPAENSDVVYSFSGYCSSASEIAEYYLNGKSPPPPPQVINEGGFWWEDPDFLRYRESDDLSQLQVMEDRLLRSKTHLMAFLEKKQNSQIVSNFDQKNHINRARSCSSPGQNPKFSQNPNCLTQSSSPIVSSCDQKNLINGAGSSSHSSDFGHKHHFLTASSSQIASFGQNSYPSFDDLSYLMNEDPSFRDNVFGLSPLQDYQEEDKWMIGLSPLQDDNVFGLSPLQDDQDKWMDKWMIGDEVIMTA